MRMSGDLLLILVGIFNNFASRYLCKAVIHTLESMEAFQLVIEAKMLGITMQHGRFSRGKVTHDVRV